MWGRGPALCKTKLFKKKEQRTHYSTCVAVVDFLYPHGDVACRTCGSQLREIGLAGSLI